MNAMDFTTSKESLMLYKLIILYMLNQVSFPLSKAQISEFVLEKGYTNYLTLQQILAELTDNNLIASSITRHRTQFTITNEGRDTLGFFQGRINYIIKTEIKEYLKEHSLALRNEISIISDYYKIPPGDYETVLSAKDGDTTLIELKLSVPTSQMADSICENWRLKNQEVYETLTRILF